MIQVDLNSDLGESYGAYRLGCDEEVISVVTSVNIACGWHAGDAETMARTVELAAKAGVAIGAHPGYPDLLGFGRRNMAVSPRELKAYVQYQVGALAAFCKAKGVSMHHVKPHGALYNMAGKDIALARGICAAVKDFDRDIILLGLANSELINAAEEMGLRYASEVFADRAYEEDGSLVARGKEGSMIHDEDIAIARVVKMVTTGYVTAISGKEIPVKADSICVHGDGPKALAFVDKIRQALKAAGVEVVRFGSFIK